VTSHILSKGVEKNHLMEEENAMGFWNIIWDVLNWWGQTLHMRAIEPTLLVLNWVLSDIISPENFKTDQNGFRLWTQDLGVRRFPSWGPHWSLIIKGL
jgi:hypothetical protein